MLAEVEEAADGARLPKFVHKTLESYKKCGQLKHGAVKLLCDQCKKVELIAFSCKQRGICVSCDGMRMTQEAARLVDTVLPQIPYRQWVFTMPYDLRAYAAFNAGLHGDIHRAFLGGVTAFCVKRAKANGIVDPQVPRLQAVFRPVWPSIVDVAQWLQPQGVPSATRHSEVPSASRAERKCPKRGCGRATTGTREVFIMANEICR